MTKTCEEYVLNRLAEVEEELEKEKRNKHYLEEFAKDFRKSINDGEITIKESYGYSIVNGNEKDIFIHVSPESELYEYFKLFINTTNKN